MTATAEYEIVDHRTRSMLPDRRILSRRELDALSILVDILEPVRSGAARDMECTERHVFGDFQIDVHMRRVLRGAVAVHLPPREYDLLVALARRDGVPASSDELIREVWKGEVAPRSRTLAQHISSLRRKLEQDPAAPRYIKTIAKFGYRLEGGARSLGSSVGFGTDR